MTTIEEALDTLHGDRETFRPLLAADAILKRICRTAEMRAQQKGVPPWSIISGITGHGSGVSNAIYQVYRTQQEEKHAPLVDAWNLLEDHREGAMEAFEGADQEHRTDYSRAAYMGYCTAMDFLRRAIGKEVS